MRPIVTLEYRGRRETRPKWVTRLGVTSLVLGTFGAGAGILRSRDAWAYVFDSTFHWNYPPAAIVPPIYLAAVLLAIGVSALLVTAGIVSLVRHAMAPRIHLLYAVIKLPLVAITGLLEMLLRWRNPGAGAYLLATDVAFEILVFGAYPTFVLVVVWRQLRKTRPKLEGPAPAGDCRPKINSGGRLLRGRRVDEAPNEDCTQ